MAFSWYIECKDIHVPHEAHPKASIVDKTLNNQETRWPNLWTSDGLFLRYPAFLSKNQFWFSLSFSTDFCSVFHWFPLLFLLYYCHHYFFSSVYLDFKLLFFYFLRWKSRLLTCDWSYFVAQAFRATHVPECCWWVPTIFIQKLCWALKWQHFKEDQPDAFEHAGESYLPLQELTHIVGMDSPVATASLQYLCQPLRLPDLQTASPYARDVPQDPASSQAPSFMANKVWQWPHTLKIPGLTSYPAIQRELVR